MSYRDAYKNLPNCEKCGKQLSKKGYTLCIKCSAKKKFVKIEKTCLCCGEKFFVILSRINSSKYCSRACFFKHRIINGKNNPNYRNGNKISGGKNPNWKGGLAYQNYPMEFCKELKELIRIRDNHTCQYCGKPESDLRRKLNVHHIDYDKKNLLPKNLISLCDSCHSKTNFNRERWIKKLTLRTKRLENKNMEMVLHDIKYLIKGVHMLPDISDHNKVKRICDVLQETIDNLYADVLKMSKNPNKKGI